MTANRFHGRKPLCPFQALVICDVFRFKRLEFRPGPEKRFDGLFSIMRRRRLVLHGCANGLQVTLRKPADRSLGRENVLLPAPHLSKLLENDRQFNLCVFGAVGFEALKDLFAIHPRDGIVSTRLKMLVEISRPSFAPDGGFLMVLTVTCQTIEKTIEFGKELGSSSFRNYR